MLMPTELDASSSSSWRWRVNHQLEGGALYALVRAPGGGGDAPAVAALPCGAGVIASSAVPTDEMLLVSQPPWAVGLVSRADLSAVSPEELASSPRVAAARGPPAGAPHVDRVSVVVPTYALRHAHHAVVYECFCRQTWLDKELLVIDTGPLPSPFFTALGGADCRVAYVHAAGAVNSLSIGVKRNLALERFGAGAMCANFDDDDIYAPSYLATMVARLRERPDAELVKLSSWFVLDLEARRCEERGGEGS